MDVLSNVLSVVRLSGAVFFMAEFSAPWAIESKRELLAGIVKPEVECVVLFHILVDGECTVECGALPPMNMTAGDVIVFPHGDLHIMRSDDGKAKTSIGSVFSPATGNELPQVRFGGGGRQSRFICGYLCCEQRFHPLVGALPTILLVRSRDDYAGIEAIDHRGARSATVPHGSGTWLGTTLKFTVHEAKAARPGNGAMLGRLTELMFMELLRVYMQQLPADHGGWLAGVNHPQVGKALRLLHADPVRNWTVDELAHEVAISRSVLAARFAELVGASPMHYLLNWRMQLAKQMLRESRTVQDVALRVGYESEAAFNRAFKRVTGAPPVSWRKAQ